MTEQTTKKPCLGTLKPVNGSCVGCTQYQQCLESHMGITQRLSDYRREA